MEWGQRTLVALLLFFLLCGASLHYPSADTPQQLEFLRLPAGTMIPHPDFRGQRAVAPTPLFVRRAAMETVVMGCSPTQQPVIRITTVSGDIFWVPFATFEDMAPWTKEMLGIEERVMGSCPGR